MTEPDSHEIAYELIGLDSRGVVWSVKKGLNRRLESGEKRGTLMPVLRAIIGWTYSNKAASSLKSYFWEKNYCLIRYEDLVEAPIQILKRLEDFLDLDLNISISTAQKAREGFETQLMTIHRLSENMMRFSSSLVISPDYS